MSIIPAEHGTELAITETQSRFTGEQTAALQHIGVENASDGDLSVFFHVCKRSGLDPFAKQIYMISRQASEKDPNGGWRKVTKQTIQTGIDGFRLIGRRAADRARQTVSVRAPEWAHDDGSWRPVWSGSWGVPVAARVAIERDGQSFTAVAMFDEYKQTKRDGALNSMWSQRPAGQIAKCAEALAWRMAFPQDLSGIYSDDEMSQADSAVPERQSAVAAVLNPEPAPEATAETETGEAMTARTRGRMFALFGQKGIVEDEQLAGINHITGRDYTSRADLTEADAQTVIAALEQRPDAIQDAEIVEVDQ